jgi:type II secretory pathway component GspD/PulD (secretin)
MDQKQKNYTGIPVLARVPLVGSLFRSTTVNKQRQELIVLMCPQVTLTKLDLYHLRQKSEDTLHFGPEIDQNDCPDCPPRGEGKELPPPDVPSPKDYPLERH